MLVLGYLGLVAVIMTSVVGPLIAGRILADRDPDLDPETVAIEAQALMLLAGPIPGSKRPRSLPPR